MYIRKLIIMMFLLLTTVCRAGEVVSKSFSLGAGKGRYKAWGRDIEYRVFFDEFLPAVFERTLVLERFDADCELFWIFTGEHGGFTLRITHEAISVYQRLYDSPGFDNKLEGKRLRHPEKREAVEKYEYSGPLETVMVTLDYKLGLSVLINGKEVIHQECFLDVSRHQVRLITENGQVEGLMLKPSAECAIVRVDAKKRYQTMIGFGGITTPTAYSQLSEGGKRKWWELLCEYNLLIQREYPIGRRLNESMNNWDKLKDATPHYYGDNFPNGEVSDFEYIKTLRRLGGKVWFEFWALPPWVDGDVEKYATAMVNYCKTSKEKAGSPPDVVGIQNEKLQSEQMWHEMTLRLRQRLDEAGFGSVRIHMSDAGTLSGGISRAKVFRKSKEVWETIDYSATHMYDYQSFFIDPDGYDERLMEWKQAADGKRFLSTELCINHDKYQWSTYRIALAMGQLYHKNLVLADASAICYCWTLLNVEQPSFGWTRSLMVPDRSGGFVPKASSYQLRVFGAYSRRIKEDMVRVETSTDVGDLLVCGFEGKSKTVVMLNRSTRPRSVRVLWDGAQFSDLEVVDPYNENTVKKASANAEVVVDPGAIVTMSNVKLGRPDEAVLKDM